MGDFNLNSANGNLFNYCFITSAPRTTGREGVINIKNIYATNFSMVDTFSSCFASTTISGNNSTVNIENIIVTNNLILNGTFFVLANNM